MDYNSWISQYPALANVQFGSSAQTGGLPLSSGWGNPASNASIADLNGLSGGSNVPGSAASNGGVGDLPQNGFGFNMGTAKFGLDALGSLAGLYGGFQQNSLAKRSLRASTEFANTNLNNQISTFNTALEDRARSRAAVEGQTDAERDRYIADNRLRRS